MLKYWNVTALSRFKEENYLQRRVLIRGGATMYAVIETGGKQYTVHEGDVLKIEKLDVAEGEAVSFDKVLMINGDAGLKVGTPYVEGAKIEAKVLRQAKEKKIIVYKYKAKKNERKKKGHRQPYTLVEIGKLA